MSIAELLRSLLPPVAYDPHAPAIGAVLDAEAAANMKRVVYRHSGTGPSGAEDQSPYLILETQEVKTTWHPIEQGQGGGGGY